MLTLIYLHLNKQQLYPERTYFVVEDISFDYKEKFSNRKIISISYSIDVIKLISAPK
jgi:hypothetical protein